MVLKYIQKPKCIILAVIPANQDIANSDALDIAKVADPERERTIGVLTKLDLMDKGTDARAILENKTVYLKRGYVGVLNRGQKEIDEGKDFAFILEKERKFFAEEECYKHMAHRMGTPYLQRLLQKTLRAHIKACLPDVRHDLSKKLSLYTRELEDFKAALGSGSNSKQFYMTKQIQNFIEDIEIKLMGHSELIDMSELSAGAFINFKLYTEIQNKLKLALVPDEQKIAVSIMNMHGIRNLLGIQPMVLEGVCRDLISQYKNPLQDSVDTVVAILLDAVTKSAETMKSYPNLKNDVLYAVQRCIDKEADSTKERLLSHIDSEMYYINLGHPDFDGAVCEPVKPVAEPVKIWDSAGREENCSPANLTLKLMENESIQQKVQYVTIIIMKYLEIVQKEVSDVTIKYTVFFLIKKVLDFIKKELVPTLVDSGHMSSLIEDCEEIFRQKEDLDRTCSSLQTALDAIQSF
ncbi:Dynamin-1, partial [Stegodyphus mimosarum]